MYIFFYITAGLLLIYCVLIGYYKKAWDSIDDFDIKRLSDREIKTKISVIVPARNEENNIIPCLESLANQSYPRHLLEIIVVNDHSTDQTEEKIRGYPASNIKLINLHEFVNDEVINSYKKKAIEIAIEAASGDLIVTTDADCTASPDWIKCLSVFHYRYKAVFLAAPVKIEAKNSLLSIFQSLDFLTLQGITGAAVQKKFHSMCNGANLAYEKKVFFEVGGFKDIDNIASGDDMLLMHKIFSKYPDKTFFVKSDAAIVTTQAASSWKAFLQQRIRWASKADKYEDKRIFVVLLLVYLLNLFIFISLIGAIWNATWIFFFLILLMSKTIVEYPFVRRLAAFFKQERLMAYFSFLQPIHIFYIIVAGWLGLFGSYEWKSRKVK